MRNRYPLAARVTMCWRWHASTDWQPWPEYHPDGCVAEGW